MTTLRGDSVAAKFLTHHIPNDGVWFAPGDVVSLVHAAGRVQIVKDSDGEYVVMGCRPATESSVPWPSWAPTRS